MYHQHLYDPNRFQDAGPQFQFNKEEVRRLIKEDIQKKIFENKKKISEELKNNIIESIDKITKLKDTIMSNINYYLLYLQSRSNKDEYQKQKKDQSVELQIKTKIGDNYISYNTYTSERQKFWTQVLNKIKGMTIYEGDTKTKPSEEQLKLYSETEFHLNNLSYWYEKSSELYEMLMSINRESNNMVPNDKKKRKNYWTNDRKYWKDILKEWIENSKEIHEKLEETQKTLETIKKSIELTKGEIKKINEFEYQRFHSNYNLNTENVWVRDNNYWTINNTKLQDMKNEIIESHIK